MEDNPYLKLPASAFWKGAAWRHDAKGIAIPKRKLMKEHRVATAGSCFAQHVARRLVSLGFNFVDVEPAPILLRQDRHNDFGYGLFSARYGNIYTAAQLRQLLLRAHGKFKPNDRYWESDGRFYDPFRPTVEPNGFASLQEMEADRESHLTSVRRLVRNIDVFVFTLGLTEAWRSRTDGAVFPVCPGVRGIGKFDAEQYEFVNFGYQDVYDDLSASLNMIKKVNPEVRFILTVSPVPLVATASGKHVLSATIYSKSILRAVAGKVETERPDVDYFPSYELVTGHPFQGMAFEPNMRAVSESGVDFVMKTFQRDFCEEDAGIHSGEAICREGGRDEEDFLSFSPPRALRSKQATRGYDSQAPSTRRDGEGKLLENAPRNRKRKHDVTCDEEILAAYAPER